MKRMGKRIAKQYIAFDMAKRYARMKQYIHCHSLLKEAVEYRPLTPLQWFNLKLLLPGPKYREFQDEFDPI